MINLGYIPRLADEVVPKSSRALLRVGISDVIWGLYWDDGKENGNYYSILGFIWG